MRGILKKVRIAMAVILLLLQASCAPKETGTPEQGMLTADNYENRALGIFFEKPAGWSFEIAQGFSEFWVAQGDRGIGLNIEPLEGLTFEEWQEEKIVELKRAIKEEEWVLSYENVGASTMGPLEGNTVITIIEKWAIIEFSYEKDGFVVTWRIMLKITQNTSWESLEYEEVQAYILNSYT